MAQDIYDVTIHNLSGGRAHIIATRADGSAVQSTLRASKINTPEKVAAWLVVRRFEPASRDDTLTRRLTVTWHDEPGPEGGPVVDDVTTERLPVDAARRNLPTAAQVRALDVETPVDRAQLQEAVARLVEYALAESGVR